MTSKNRMEMALHGVIVVLLGLLAGFPYALVVTGQMGGEERAWHTARASRTDC